MSSLYYFDHMIWGHTNSMLVSRGGSHAQHLNYTRHTILDIHFHCYIHIPTPVLGTKMNTGTSVFSFNTGKFQGFVYHLNQVS